MNLSDVFRDNAEDCAFLAERVEDREVKRALKRMEEAGARWRKSRTNRIIEDGQQKQPPL